MGGTRATLQRSGRKCGKGLMRLSRTSVCGVGSSVLKYFTFCADECGQKKQTWERQREHLRSSLVAGVHRMQTHRTTKDSMQQASCPSGKKAQGCCPSQVED